MGLDDVDEDLLTEVREDPVVFVREVLGEEPYRYQREFLRSEKPNKAFVAGRQVGKTTVLCWYVLWKFVTHPNSLTLIFAPSQRQSLNFFDAKMKAEIATWIDNPDDYGITYEAKTEMRGSNGAKIMALPAANRSGAGETVRGYSADCIVVDEAAFVDDEFYTSVLAPMTLTTDGDFILAGTPWGQQGFFYDRFHNDRWYSLRVSTMENPDIAPEKIESFREDLTETEFQREILGEFVQKENAAFPEKAIKACIYQGEELGDNYPDPTGKAYYLGVDPARHGDDRAVFCSMDSNGNVFEVETLQRCSLPEIENKIQSLHRQRAYADILVDETGLGGGPVDALKGDIRNLDGVTFTLKRKMELYQTLRKAMEDEEICLPDDKPLITELRGMEREATPRGRMKYQAESGGHDDFPDALALANWARLDGRTVDRATGVYSFNDDDDSDGSGSRAYSFGS